MLPLPTNMSAEAAGHLEPTRQDLLLFAVPGRHIGIGKFVRVFPDLPCITLLENTPKPYSILTVKTLLRPL